MSMRLDSYTAQRLVKRWDKEETAEIVSAMSDELKAATEHGKFGRSDAGMSFGYSLAASVQDPIFLEKFAALLDWRFSI